MSRAFQLGYAARSLIEFIFILLPSISVISHVRTMRDWASLPLTPIKGPFSFTSGLSLQLFRQRICYNMSMINLSGERNFGCSTCKTHLATIHSLISRVSSISSSPSLLYFTLLWILGFQWPTWSCISFWLRVSIHYHKVQSLQLTAYYFRRVNVVEGEPYDVPMTTGNHTIRDISCCKCGTTLGRKYVNALFNLLHSWVHRTSRSRRTNCRRSTRKVNISLSVVSSWTFSRFACTPSWRRYYTAAMIQGAGFIVFVSLFALITSMYHRKGEGCWRCPHGGKKFSCNDYHVLIQTAIFSFLSSTNLAKTARCTLFISHLLSTNQRFGK